MNGLRYKNFIVKESTCENVLSKKMPEIEDKFKKI